MSEEKQDTTLNVGTEESRILSKIGTIEVVTNPNIEIIDGIAVADFTSEKLDTHIPSTMVVDIVDSRGNKLDNSPTSRVYAAIESPVYINSHSMMFLPMSSDLNISFPDDEYAGNYIPPIGLNIKIPHSAIRRPLKYFVGTEHDKYMMPFKVLAIKDRYSLGRRGYMHSPEEISSLLYDRKNDIMTIVISYADNRVKKEDWGKSSVKSAFAIVPEFSKSANHEVDIYSLDAVFDYDKKYKEDDAVHIATVSCVGKPYSLKDDVYIPIIVKSFISHLSKAKNPLSPAEPDGLKTGMPSARRQSFVYFSVGKKECKLVTLPTHDTGFNSVNIDNVKRTPNHEIIAADLKSIVYPDCEQYFDPTVPFPIEDGWIRSQKYVILRNDKSIFPLDRQIVCSQPTPGLYSAHYNVRYNDGDSYQYYEKKIVTSYDINIDRKVDIGGSKVIPMEQAGTLLLLDSKGITGCDLMGNKLGSTKRRNAHDALIQVLPGSILVGNKLIDFKGNTLHKKCFRTTMDIGGIPGKDEHFILSRLHHRDNFTDGVNIIYLQNRNEVKASKYIELVRDLGSLNEKPQLGMGLWDGNISSDYRRASQWFGTKDVYIAETGPDFKHHITISDASGNIICDLPGKDKLEQSNRIYQKRSFYGYSYIPERKSSGIMDLGQSLMRSLIYKMNIQGYDIIVFTHHTERGPGFYASELAAMLSPSNCGVTEQSMDEFMYSSSLSLALTLCYVKRPGSQDWELFNAIKAIDGAELNNIVLYNGLELIVLFFDDSHNEAAKLAIPLSRIDSLKVFRESLINNPGRGTISYFSREKWDERVRPAMTASFI